MRRESIFPRGLDLDLFVCLIIQVEEVPFLLVCTVLFVFLGLVLFDRGLKVSDVLNTLIDYRSFSSTPPIVTKYDRHDSTYFTAPKTGIFMGVLLMSGT